MNFLDVLKIETKKEDIILGYDDSGLLTNNIKKDSSIIITGETGSGKSILLDQILLELISRYTSLEMSLILIDTSGVELNYYKDTNYTILSAMNDLDKSVVILSKVLREIERRKKILKENKAVTVDEYNKTATNKLPLLVVAIDDDKSFLKGPDLEKMLSGIISQISGLNIVFLLATSDVYNDFFEIDYNTYASMLISFDYSNKNEARNINIQGAEDLEIGTFLVKKDKEIKKYHNFDFDDKMIEEIINR